MIKKLEQLYDENYCLYGDLDNLVNGMEETDSMEKLTRQYLKEVVSRHGTQLDMSMAYHPQTGGQVTPLKKPSPNFVGHAAVLVCLILGKVGGLGYVEGNRCNGVILFGKWRKAEHLAILDLSDSCLSGTPCLSTWNSQSVKQSSS
ncbi:hypothetical protein Tco_0006705 [Tanacetum coccineum]